MLKRKFLFDGDVEAEIYELLGWDLPGHKAPKRVSARRPRRRRT